LLFGAPSCPSILKRLDAIEAKLNINRSVGNWVRSLSGALVWDPHDLDAVADGAMDRVQAQLEEMAKRMRGSPDYVPLTPTQVEDAKRALDEAIERIRAERQAIRDFTAFVEAELAKGVPLSAISEPPSSPDGP
jgi:hypothetical protein